MQDGANLLIEVGTQVGDHPTNHRLGQADIDVVVGKVVPAKGTPAQRILGHISGADHQSAAAVCHIHQNLGALTCLCIFIGDIPHRRVVSDVLKMLQDRCLDGNVTVVGSQSGNQAQSVVVGAVGSAKAGHGNGNQIVCRQVQLLERLMADQQRKGGIQSAGHAQHQTMQTGVGNAGNQSLHL